MDYVLQIGQFYLKSDIEWQSLRCRGRGAFCEASEASELQTNFLFREYCRDGEYEEGENKSLHDTRPTKIEVRLKKCDPEGSQKKIPEIGEQVSREGVCASGLNESGPTRLAFHIADPVEKHEKQDACCDAVERPGWRCPNF